MDFPAAEMTSKGRWCHHRSRGSLQLPLMILSCFVNTNISTKSQLYTQLYLRLLLPS